MREQCVSIMQIFFEVLLYQLMFYKESLITFLLSV